MFALRLESVFVGDIVDGVSLVGDRVDPTEATAYGKSFVFGTSISQFGGFLMVLTVGEFIAVVVITKADIVGGSFLNEHHVLLRFRKSESDSQNGEEGYDLRGRGIKKDKLK